jgi:hypothetical protein
MTPFAGNANDPFSFHKYGFVHGDPVQGTDPSGELLGLLVGFTLRAMLIRAAIGAVVGAIDYALDDSEDKSLLGRVAFGAGFAVLGPVIPWYVGVPLVASGLIDAGLRGDLDLLAFRGATILLGAGIYNAARNIPGGRLGNLDTRIQNAQLWMQMFIRGQWRLSRGGTVYSEEYIPPPGGAGRTGPRGKFVDVTLTRMVNGVRQVMRIQTVDTNANGAPTARELTAINYIRTNRPNDILVAIPKEMHLRMPWGTATTVGESLEELFDWFDFLY